MSGDIQIEFVETASSIPLVAELCIKGWNELFRNGLADGRLVFHSGMSAIIGYAKNGRDMVPAGVVLFGVEPDFKRTWITLAYVEPEFRGRGVYNTLWNAVVATSRANNVRSIESATHVRNTAMRAVAKRQNRAEEFVILVHKLD